MDGDTGVISPEGWEHPAHWPQWYAEEEEEDAPPSLPQNQNAGDKIDLSQNRLTLGIDPAPPSRSDLESIFDDMRHSATDLKSLGNIGNMSRIFASALDRFLATLPKTTSIWNKCVSLLVQIPYACGLKAKKPIWNKSPPKKSAI